MSRIRLIALLSMVALAVGGVWAQSVRIVVTSEFANIRTLPALGADVIDSIGAGFVFDNVTARSADGEWLRVEYVGQEGWVNITPIAVLAGDINALPVADPRSIPYGGVDAPRAGITNAVGAVFATASNNVRVRSGPSRAYPTIASIFTNQPFTITGRTSSNGWLQVSYQNTLGWLSSQYVQNIVGDINALPVDGIVADSRGNIGDSADDYFGVLRLMLDRLNLAQPSLDTIRAYWTDSALTGRAACRAYPAQPSDVQIAQPVLAAYYAALEPLRVDFNDAMANVRTAINLFIEICNLPGTGNPVGQATVEGALGVVNLAQGQFDSLRDRILALLPPDAGNNCLLVYNGRTELLPIVQIGTIYLDEFTARDYSTGYCFEGVQGQTITVQTLPFPDSNVAIFLAISPVDAPTNFVAINQTSANTRLYIGPITLPRTTRYAVIIADLNNDGGAAPKGKFAFLLSQIVQGQTTPPAYLVYNTSTQAIQTTQNIGDPIYSDSAGVVSITPTPFGGVSPTSTPGAVSVVCPSTSFSCNQLFTCQEAQACFAAGNFTLDSDGDGIPCEGTISTNCPVSGTADN